MKLTKFYTCMLYKDSKLSLDLKSQFYLYERFYNSGFQKINLYNKIRAILIKPIKEFTNVIKGYRLNLLHELNAEINIKNNKNQINKNEEIQIKEILRQFKVNEVCFFRNMAIT